LALAEAVTRRKEQGEPNRWAAVDMGFVAAPRARIYDVLVAPQEYPRWWPGARAGTDGVVRMPGLGAVRVRTDRERPGVGVFVQLEGSGFRGDLEWYLEPFKEGTVVYGITNVESVRRWRERRILAVRSGIRSAMVALQGLRGDRGESA